MGSVLFQNASIIDGQSTETREGYDVIVENDKIKEVSDKRIKISTGETINLAGKTLIPGLIDAHVHVKATEVNVCLLYTSPSPRD